MHEIVLTGESDSNIVEIYDLFIKMTKPSEIKFEYIILPNVEILSEKILLQFQNKKALIFVINSTSSSLQKSVSFFHQIMLSSKNWTVAIAPNATNNKLNRIPSKEIGSIFKLDTCNHLIKEGLVQSIHLSSKQNDVKILLDWLMKSLAVPKKVKFNENDEIKEITPLIDRIDEEFPFLSHLPDSEKPKKVREFNKAFKSIQHGQSYSEDETENDIITKQNTKLNSNKKSNFENEFVTKFEYLKLEETVSKLIKKVESQDLILKQQQMTINQLMETHKLLIHKMNKK
jgi:hypothetical protein